MNGNNRCPNCNSKDFKFQVTKETTIITLKKGVGTGIFCVGDFGFEEHDIDFKETGESKNEYSYIEYAECAKCGEKIDMETSRELDKIVLKSELRR